FAVWKGTGGVATGNFVYQFTAGKVGEHPHYMDRRRFLLGSAAAAQAALAQSPPQEPVKPLPDSERVPTAIIGTGGRGSYLLRAALDQPNAKVAGLCDIKPDRLDRAATTAARDNPSTTTDWHKIVERRDIDAVFIATPPHLHSEMAIAALKAGKHVYCEKPIGVTARNVRDLVHAARASKKVFTAGQQLRSMRQFREAVDKIREGVLGDILMVKAQRHAVADLPHDGTSGDWYFDVNKSGGYLIEQSVHNLDLCNWVTGSRPARVVGFGGTSLYRNDPPGRSIFDHGSMTYEYANGVQMSFTQNVFHPRTMPAGSQYVYVYGSKGAVDLFAPSNFYPRDPGAKAELFVTPGDRRENQHAHIARFYESIQKGTPSPADVVIGAEAAVTAIMGHEAMTRGKVITWADMGVDL
ncbi:MAG TPA: Gfo/Idh/MocA family oxidoreductase, partial [Bryobacteraceae bacterium]|nr:Gfo/Idh/MocA family oxidoreductase [Bryobacteraceae bacterium]